MSFRKEKSLPIAATVKTKISGELYATIKNIIIL